MPRSILAGAFRYVRGNPTGHPLARRIHNGKHLKASLALVGVHHADQQRRAFHHRMINPS